VFLAIQDDSKMGAVTSRPAALNPPACNHTPRWERSP
jgi:hypothetical protein